MSSSGSRPALRTTTFDVVVLFLIGALGALEFVLSCRAVDYVFDTNYVDLARSIANHAGYGFNHKPMTQLPPGMSYLMAWMGLTTSASYGVVVRLMTVLTTLALMTSYKLLSAQEGRGVATACCLLLESSPFLFEFSTRMVFTDVPYWFASILLLYAAFKLDAVTTWGHRQVLLWVAWGIGLVATIVVRSAAMSLLGGLCCWIAWGYFSDRKTGIRRFRLFIPAIIAASAAQGCWMLWAHSHQFHEWSIPGYQDNYIAQLKLKNANDPELGLASWQDFMARPVTNADDIGSAVFEVFTHKKWPRPGTPPGAPFPCF